MLKMEAPFKDISNTGFNRLPKVSSYNRQYCSKSTTVQDVVEITKTKLSIIHFLMSIGILNNNYKCPICNDFMMFVQNTSAKGSSDGYMVLQKDCE